jgi:hypothetical protein
MQFDKERWLSQDQHRRYVQAVENDRLARSAQRRTRRGLRQRGTILGRLIGLFFFV